MNMRLLLALVAVTASLSTNAFWVVNTLDKDIIVNVMIGADAGKAFTIAKGSKRDFSKASKGEYIQFGNDVRDLRLEVAAQNKTYHIDLRTGRDYSDIQRLRVYSVVNGEEVPRYTKLSKEQLDKINIAEPLALWGIDKGGSFNGITLVAKMGIVDFQAFGNKIYKITDTY